MASDRKTTSRPQSFLGVHHLKLAARDLKTTYDFYTKHLPLTKLPHLDHHDKDGTWYASLCMHEATKLLVEIRQNSKQAIAQVGWDPVTWGVQGKADLEQWGEYFDANGIKHSKVLFGAKGWVMGVEDPDGKIIKLYTLEEHEWSDNTDEDAYWLGPTAQ